jgi:type II secretory pathway pseudopilin PulG
MNLKKAFSLTELSVVVLVASAVLVGILSVQTSSNSTNKTKVTNDRIGQIYKALKVYVGAHKRLPCPASIAFLKMILLTVVRFLALLILWFMACCRLKI